MIFESGAAISLHFAPDLPWLTIYVLAGLSILLLITSAFLYRRGLFWRGLCAAAFLLLLLNSSVLEEQREAVKDVVAIIVDDSPSQNFAQRSEVTEQAVTALEQTLSQLNDRLDVRVTRTTPATADAIQDETRLFAPLDNIMSDVRPSRRAGAIFVTDGQIHDIPSNPEILERYGPVHTLLTGSRDERDRRLVILEAPAYGIVGQDITVRYKVEQTGIDSTRGVTVTSRLNDKPPRRDYVPVGIEQSTTFTIEHAGQNVIDLDVTALDDEITAANNRMPLIINGVRDRLKVLLVSGQPHAGGRMWRDLLTADPGVDLVHFTILREPHKLDATPQRELSLIAFPFRELFEIKLYDFDLIIFDRYRLNRILPHYYFANIARYVREGGALLEASGPSFATENSLYTTALKDILPAYPSGQVFNESFTPQITDEGRLHPVTKDLYWQSPNNNEDSDAPWGPWLRHVMVQPLSGHTLMNGLRNMPLVMLDRVGEGRVAQIASDHLWLWARGYNGGGPQAELLRRMAHWLMKEPELEENALDVRSAGNRIHIERRTLTPADMAVDITGPDGTVQSLTLTPDDNGILHGSLTVNAPGIYSISDGIQKRFTVIGTLNPKEYRDVVTTDKHMEPVAETTNGSVKWLEDNAQPGIRLVQTGQRFSGAGWIGLRHNRDYDVTGVKDSPLLPLWVYALLMTGLTLLCWWFEGHRQKS